MVVFGDIVAKSIDITFILWYTLPIYGYDV